jgi:hypothetical protein
MRYSLRTLAIAIAILSALLGGWAQHRRTTMCQVRWLKPGSPEARALVPAAVVERIPAPGHPLQLANVSGSSWRRVVYCPSHRGFQSLMKVAQQAIPTPGLPVAGLTPWNQCGLQGDHSLEIVTSDATLAEAQLKTLRQADVSRPGVFVIRGRVVDRDGKPLVGVRVVMMGSYTFNSPFRTRKDGTFIMSLEDGVSTPPAGGAYYLLVFYEYGQRWPSRTFYFDLSVPERDVIITVPQ